MDVSCVAMAFSKHFGGHNRKTSRTLSPFLSTCLSVPISWFAYPLHLPQEAPSLSFFLLTVLSMTVLSTALRKPRICSNHIQNKGTDNFLKTKLKNDSKPGPASDAELSICNLPLSGNKMQCKFIPLKTVWKQRRTRNRKREHLEDERGYWQVVESDKRVSYSWQHYQRWHCYCWTNRALHLQSLLTFFFLKE